MKSDISNNYNREMNLSEKLVKIASSTYGLTQNGEDHDWQLQKDVQVYSTIGNVIQEVLNSQCIVWAFHKEERRFILKATSPVGISEAGISILQYDRVFPNEEWDYRFIDDELLEGDNIFSAIATKLDHSNILLLKLQSPKSAELVGLAACVVEESENNADSAIDLLKLIGTQAALSVDHARLIERLSEISNVAGSIAEHSNSIGVLRLILENAINLPGFSQGQLYLVMQNEKELYLVEWKGEITIERITIGNGILGEVAATHKPIYKSNLSEVDASELHYLSDRDGSLFAVPVLAGAELIGVLCIESKQRDAFSTLDIYHINSIAKLISIIVFGFHHMMGMAHFDIRLRSMVHQIPSRITLIAGFSKQLLKRLENGQVDEKTIAFARHIVDKSEAVHKDLNMVQDIFDVGDVLSPTLCSPRLRLEPLILDDLLAELITTLQPTYDPDDIDIQLTYEDNSYDFKGIRELIHIGFMQILQNSIEEFGENGGNVSITMGIDQMGKIVVTIRDTGEGIPRDKQDSIFERGGSTKEGHEGLGLFIANYVIQRHGGTIVYEDNPDNGATFVITLPRRTGDLE